MFLYSLYIFINLTCNCTLSEHAIKSQVHMIQCSHIHTWVFHMFFHRVFHRSQWYSSMYQKALGHLKDWHKALLYHIIHSNVAEFWDLASTYDTSSCIKCTLTDSEIYAILRRVAILKNIIWQGECRTFYRSYLRSLIFIIAKIWKDCCTYDTIWCDIWYKLMYQNQLRNWHIWHCLDLKSGLY